MLYGDTSPYLPTQVTNRNGQAVNATYDNYGSTTSSDAPVNDSQRLTVLTSYLYTDFALGRVDNITVGAKTPTNFTYYTGNMSVNSVPQPNGMVKTVRSPMPGVQDGGAMGAQVTTTYVYTALGNVSSVMSPAPNGTLNATVTTSYNYVADGGFAKTEALGEPLTTTDPNGNITHFRYDTHGNTLSVVDPSGNETDYTYNYLDQVTKVTYPPAILGGARAYVLYIYTFSDNTGPLKSTQLYNEAGVLERQSSRTAGSENETTQVSGSTEAVSTTLDSLYRPTAILDGKGRSHLSAYNSIGQLSKFTFPNYNAGTGYDSYNATGFDNDHNLTGFTDGNAKSFVFDIASLGTGDGRLKAAHYPAVPGLAAFDATYTYDGYGRVSSVVYGGDTYAYTFDDNNLVITETDTYAGLPARVLTYVYNNDGSRANMEVNVNVLTNVPLSYAYTYDNGGRLTNTAFAWGDSVTNSYQANDWLLTQNTAVTHTTYAFDGRGYRTLLDNTSPSDSAVHYSKFDNFTFDALGNVLTVRANIPGTGAGIPAIANSSILTYIYDSGVATNQDRLTSEDSPRNSVYNARYTYAHASDASDNLTTLRGTLYAYNFDNQFSSGATYDGQGNPTTYNWSGTNTPLVWTAEDRLAQFGTSPNTNEFTAGYRPDGLRAWKQVGTASTARTYFLYDSGHVFAELDSTGALTSAYGWGAAGLVERRAVSSSLTYGYTFDTTGSVIQRHHIGGATYADYATCYDAFGAQLGSYNNGGFVANTQDAVGWAGQWGGYTDQATAAFGSGSSPIIRYPLVLLGHRYYDPGAGRFLNRDPMGLEGGVNVYAYCTNNPINQVDPDGSQSVTNHAAEAVVEYVWKPTVAAKVAQKAVTHEVAKQGAKRLSKSLILVGVVKFGGTLAVKHLLGPVMIAHDLYEVYHYGKALGDYYNELTSVSMEDVLADQSAPIYAKLRSTAVSKATTQKHHIFVQKHRAWFKARGININDWCIELGVRVHLSGMHGRGRIVFNDVLLPGYYNKRWDDFIDEFQDADLGAVVAFGLQLQKEYGMTGLPWVKYGKAKAKE